MVSKDFFRTTKVTDSYSGVKSGGRPIPGPFLTLQHVKPRRISWQRFDSMIRPWARLCYSNFNLSGVVLR